MTYTSSKTATRKKEELSDAAYRRLKDCIFENIGAEKTAQENSAAEPKVTFVDEPLPEGTITKRYESPWESILKTLDRADADNSVLARLRRMRENKDPKTGIVAVIDMGDPFYKPFNLSGIQYFD